MLYAHPSSWYELILVSSVQRLFSPELHGLISIFSGLPVLERNQWFVPCSTWSHFLIVNPDNVADLATASLHFKKGSDCSFGHTNLLLPLAHSGFFHVCLTWTDVSLVLKFQIAAKSYKIQIQHFESKSDITSASFVISGRSLTWPWNCSSVKRPIHLELLKRGEGAVYKNGCSL